MNANRRQFSALAALAPWAAGALPALVACSSGAPSPYNEAVRALWRHGEVDRDNPVAVRRELVRYATLAPSSHNTQCWRFGIEADAMTLQPDLSRRCPAVDPDDHHLFISIGCALENLVQAAAAHGLQAQPTVDATSGAVRVKLAPAPPERTALFDAIVRRQSTRGDYDGNPLAEDELRLLLQAASVGGVRPILLTGRPALEKVLEFVVQANTAQMRDAAFMKELRAWIRFSAADALARGDGLYAASSGNPSVPAWLGDLLFEVAFTEKGESDKYARHLRSSAGVVVFVGPADTKAGWVQVGRAYERFALQATALGVRTAHLNQPVEVAAVRPQFARFLGIAGQRPDLVVRFGRGPALPPSLRRPVDAVL